MIVRRRPGHLAALLAAFALPLLAGFHALAPGQANVGQRLAIFAPGKLPYFSYGELVSLSQDQPLPKTTQDKLSTILNSAVLDNSAPNPPAPLQVKELGPTLRVAEWNIERGENFDWIVLALKDEKGFRQKIKADNPKITPAQLDKIAGQAHDLAQASTLILDEVDLGMNRSQYHDVARDLAAALKMNFVFAVSFVEVDPLKLGTEELTDADAGGDDELRTELESELKADPGRYKGLHGSAILSRYPISNVRVQHLPVCHDWFQGEIATVAKLEQAKRFASDKIFLEKIEREVRRGGRIAIIADLKVKDAPGGVVTVVNAHLENKCPPECRRKQMRAILEGIGNVRNPLILAGDMNTSGSDASHLSLAYLVKTKATDYRFWGRTAIMMTTPLPSLYALNYYKNYTDPTVRDIKFLSDNKEAAFFGDIEKFRFADHGRFDVRGNKDRTVNKTGKRFSDSNQRNLKGFVPTFSLPRDFKGFVGRFKLDWFFIKPAVEDGKTAENLAPWYARTMVELNKAPVERISDHAPITVDLPLTAKPKAHSE
jgi:endonuclease/exonuclease/phosphatase family metal-dependent hydrolase